MAEEAKITQDNEVKEVKEGTVESEIKKTEESVVIPTKEEKKSEPATETVPLAVYLELKKDLKDLKDDIKNSKGSDKSSVKAEGLDELSKKYPDVNAEFISDILENATKQATKKLDEKYTPIIERQEAERKQEVFDKAFDNLFDKTIKENPDLPKNIDKELIKELAITAKYRNVPLAEILTKMYGTSEGRSSSENDMRNGADVVSDVVDFSKITPSQKDAIMDDPKARSKYFNWLDTQTGR